MIMDNWKIGQEEIAIARKSIDLALKAGADKVRVTLNKSVSDLCSALNGELDQVSHSGDRSLKFNIIADGRYGSFSTNRLDEANLKEFITKATAIVKALAQDSYRDLPDPSRTEKNAITGLELDLYDPFYEEMTPQRRIETVLKASAWQSISDNQKDYSPISEEVEYSDSAIDVLIMDSNGLNCRHIETSFDLSSEVTLQSGNGNKVSGFWWDSAIRFKDLDTDALCRKAFDNTLAKFNPQSVKSGKMNMIVENNAGSKLLIPILNALGGFSIQQENSFLTGTIGKKIFPEGFTIMDKPRAKGANGTRLFDSEGVSAMDRPLIENGIVKEYFINTYMAGKLGMNPTIEDAIRPEIMQFGDQSDLNGIMNKCGDGILVTGFNGGNSNSATGDFSYGIEGFAFRNGKIAFPVREMVITGNFITLWNNLIAAGTDFRPCMSRGIPTLAFKDVDFSA